MESGAQSCRMIERDFFYLTESISEIEYKPNLRIPIYSALIGFGHKPDEVWEYLNRKINRQEAIEC